MARTRSIKPQFFHDVDVMSLPPLARLLFIGLWCYADKAGRLEDRPRQIKQDVLPGDACDVDELLNVLAAAEEPFIVRYRAKGKKLIQILAFEKHQHPHHQEDESKLPPPSEADKDEPEQPSNNFRSGSESVPNRSDSIRTNPSGSCYCNGSLVTGTDKPSCPPDGERDTDSEPHSPHVSVTTTSGDCMEVVSNTGLQVVEVTPAFETWFEQEFWALYPRKVKKEAARKAARKCGAQKSEAIRQQITFGLRKHLPALEIKIATKGMEFVPHPATWLNGREWTEEPEVCAPVPRETKQDREERAFMERLAYEAELRQRFAGQQPEPRRIAQ